MWNIALVQNQSEMSHYGYADARPLIEELDYNVVLYTAQNIDDLASNLNRQTFDAIIFASNALNDKTIREEIFTPEFMNAFSSFLEGGKGGLILHQLRLAQTKNTTLEFLPPPLKSVQPIERFKNEKSSDGELFSTAITKTHVGFLYPNEIDIAQIKKQCLSYRSLRGVYWHYWDQVDNSEWDILLYDNDANGVQRPLFLSSKESKPYRIILSSLTLDWQKQTKFLQNILTYIVEGKHNTAILKDSKNTSVAFEYFIECLKSQKYPFKVYDIDQDLAILKKNIETGVHTILIFDPFIDKKTVGKELYSLIENFVLEGKMKLMGIDKTDQSLYKFFVAGRERYALRLLYDCEIKIQNELNKGYIDGSFWSTIESLQILNQLKEVESHFDLNTLERVFKLANEHDRDGSYDEVFGVTCAFLWLRATYLGTTSEETKRTLNWVRGHIAGFEDRERALAYQILNEINLITVDEKLELQQILSSLDVKNLSEIDLIVYLKASISIGYKDHLLSLIQRIEKLQNDGCWVDLATTASATTVLLDVLDTLKSDPYTDSKIKTSLESLIFKSIIFIQNSLREQQLEKNNAEYPWDNKASTSLKCIQAWLKFEDIIDIPIYETIDSLKSYSETEKYKSSDKKALVILEELKSENKQVIENNIELSNKIDKLEEQITRSKKVMKLNRFLLPYFLVSLYLIFTIVASSFIHWDDSIETILRGAFIDVYQYHMGLIFVLTLVYTILGSKSRFKVEKSRFKVEKK
ncbi:MAG: hypothetical protein PHD13_04100 [Methanocellales archaeon]|nr:hypothetical protein [Methanocellales archaeon]MDD3292099.1 hypothetical protein [Methanocellales archaeon]MDD5235336.1 hypothetical protein [Methanocellales archaeon]MDD5485716.1 hypothetical protein [Methanocellales archaeon]